MKWYLVCFFICCLVFKMRPRSSLIWLQALAPRQKEGGLVVNHTPCITKVQGAAFGSFGWKDLMTIGRKDLCLRPQRATARENEQHCPYSLDYRCVHLLVSSVPCSPSTILCNVLRYPYVIFSKSYYLLSELTRFGEVTFLDYSVENPPVRRIYRGFEGCPPQIFF